LEPVAQSEPQVACGVLTRVVAHEIGNGLNPMGLQIELLRRRCADDARASEILEALGQSVRDLGRMLDRVRDYAHEVAPPADDDDARRQLFEALTGVIRGR
jgi:nitrogen fixation/metabolism regulation signal transduction histidine kinase